MFSIHRHRPGEICIKYFIMSVTARPAVMDGSAGFFLTAQKAPAQKTPRLVTAGLAGFCATTRGQRVM
jgi:hypothetical protein